MHSLLGFGLYAVLYASLSLAAPPTTPAYVASLASSYSSASKVEASISSASVASLITASPTPPTFRDIVAEIARHGPVAWTNAAVTATSQSFSIPSIPSSLPSARPVPILDVGTYQFHPHRQISYSIPDTKTNLSIILANPGQVPPIDPEAMAKTILSLRSTITSHLNGTGDRWLNNKEDPYGWEIGLGCWLEFWSNPEKGPEGKPQHLTLGVLRVVLDGLLDRLVYKGLYDFAYVEIYDAQWGLTGMGFVAPDVGPRDQTNKLSTVLERLRIEGKR